MDSLLKFQPLASLHTVHLDYLLRVTGSPKWHDIVTAHWLEDLSKQEDAIQWIVDKRYTCPLAKPLTRKWIKLPEQSPAVPQICALVELVGNVSRNRVFAGKFWFVKAKKFCSKGLGWWKFPQEGFPGPREKERETSLPRRANKLTVRGKTLTWHVEKMGFNLLLWINQSRDLNLGLPHHTQIL